MMSLDLQVAAVRKIDTLQSVGWTQADIATHAKISQATVSRVIRGQSVKTATLQRVVDLPVADASQTLTPYAVACRILAAVDPLACIASDDLRALATAYVGIVRSVSSHILQEA